MKKMSLMALLFGGALFIGLGTTSALAQEGKCGAEKKVEKCGAKQDGKCGDGKPMTPGKCSGEKKAVTPGKCDSAKKEKAGKCGAGKCGK